MSFANVVLDHNVFVEYDLSEKLLAKMYLSTVVLYELAATTISKTDLGEFEQLLISKGNEEKLLTPSATDWWETAKLIRRVRFGEKSASHGKTPKISHANQLQNDALIARTATLAKCYVVTSDVDDFGLFKSFMPLLEIVPAKDFFDV